ncbi:MAG: trigger factor [bacterium]|nr:trigger factor [bacterium]
MKKDIKQLPGSKVELSVELTKEEFEPHWQAAYETQAKNVKVKGFRAGKAPKEFVDSSVDKDKAFSEALREAVGKNLSDLSAERDWVIIDQPQVEVSELTDDGGLKYSATLTLFPEIKLADYKKLAKKILAEKKEPKFEEEEVAKSIEYLQNSRAKEIRVEREAKDGDLLEIDVETKCGGELVPGATLSKDRFILGQSKFIEGFDKKLIAKKAGEEFEFSLPVPADYWQKDYAGKAFDFKLKVQGVFEREVPELNDEFAKTLSPQIKNVKDLEDNIREGLKQEKEKKELERVQIKLVEEIAEESKMEIPEVMKERMLEAMVAETMSMMGGRQVTDQEKMKAEMRKQFAKEAEKRVKVNLVLHEIAKQENLEPSKKEIEDMAKLQNLDVDKYYDYIYGNLQNKKIFAFLNSFKKEE